MTETEQRIAIAEACGWRTNKEMETCAVVNPFQAPDGSWHSAYPNYLHDLNAIHEAALSAGEPVIKAMRAYLWEICGQMKAHEATAAQRCEAFLVVTGRWISPIEL